MEQSPLFWIFNIVIVVAASALTIYSARARKGAGGYLCEDCRFNSPEKCLKSIRPFALVCTSYRQLNNASVLTGPSRTSPTALASSASLESSTSLKSPASSTSSASESLESLESPTSSTSPASVTTNAPLLEEDL